MTNLYTPVNPINPSDLGNLEDIENLGRKYDIPVLILPEFKNGLYVAPSPNRYKIGKNEILNYINRLRNNPKGGILIGESTESPTIVAHEIGHSKNKGILNKIRGWSEKNLNNYYIPILGTLGAILAGELLPEYRRGIAAGNIGAQALTALPTLLDEYKASEKAKEIYDKSDRSLLRQLLWSYTKNDLLKKKLLPSMIGALGHEVYSRMR
jgi:hypothetical protein